MKKIVIFVFSLLIIILSGCTKKNNFVNKNLTNEEKLKILNDIKSPNNDLLKMDIILNNSILDSDEHANISLTSYTYLKDSDSFYEYLESSIDIDFNDIYLYGNANIYLKDLKAYLDLKAQTKRNGNTITLENKEKMTVPEFLNFEEVNALINLFRKGELDIISTKEFKDIIKNNISKLEILEKSNDLIINYNFNNEEVITIIEKLGQSFSKYNSVIETIDDETSLKLSIKTTNLETTSLSLEGNVAFKLNERKTTSNIKIIIDYKSKEPILPTKLDGYREVEFFTVIKYLQN